MRLIKIDSQMIAKDKNGYYCTKILYWVIVRRLRINNEFKSKVLIYRGFTHVFSLLYDKLAKKGGRGIAKPYIDETM